MTVEPTGSGNAAGLGSPSKPEKSRRLGRPPRQRSGEIAERILTAAKELFLSEGYEATSMEAVALAAPVSKRTLYARYATKQALIQAVINHRVRSWSQEATARAGSLPSDFRERMYNHAEVLIHALADPEIQRFDRLIISTASRFPEIAKTYYDLGYRYELEFLATEIAHATQDDPVPAHRPEHVARQLLSMIMGWRRTEETVRTIPPEEARQFARDAVDLLFAGRAAW